MSPIAARKLAATITFTPGTPISRRISADSSASWRSAARPRRSLLSRNSIWRIALSTRLALLAAPARSSASHSRPLTPNRSLKRRAADELAHQHRVDLVLGAAARPHQLSAPRQAPAHHPRLPVRHPDRVQRPGRQQPRQRPGIQAVGLRPGLADPGVEGLTTSTCATCGSRIRAISHAFPVTSSATRSSGPRLRGEQLDLLGLGLDPTSRANLTILDDRDLTEIQMHIQPDRSHHNLLTLSSNRTGDAVGKRHRRIRARSATGQVAGAANEKPGLKQHPSSNEPACPTCVLPESPCPGHPTLTRPSQNNSPQESFSCPEKHSSGRPLGSRLLSTEAGVSAAGEAQLSSAWRRRRTTPIGGCLTSRPAGLGLNTVPRTPQRLARLECWTAGAGAMTLDLADRGATRLGLTPDARMACV